MRRLVIRKDFESRGTVNAATYLGVASGSGQMSKGSEGGGVYGTSVKRSLAATVFSPHTA